MDPSSAWIGLTGSNKLFSCFHQMLDQKGLIAKAGSIIDASFVDAPASTHDSHIFEELLAKKDQAILADSAYKSEKNEPVMLDHNLEDFIIAKAYRNKPLTEHF